MFPARVELRRAAPRVSGSGSPTPAEWPRPRTAATRACMLRAPGRPGASVTVQVRVRCLRECRGQVSSQVPDSAAKVPPLVEGSQKTTPHRGLYMSSREIRGRGDPNLSYGPGAGLGEETESSALRPSALLLKRSGARSGGGRPSAPIEASYERGGRYGQTGNRPGQRSGKRVRSHPGARKGEPGESE